jgi:hypothetical protein
MADSVRIAVLSKQPFCTVMVDLEAQLLCYIKLNVFIFLEQDSERRFRVVGECNNPDATKEFRKTGKDNNFPGFAISG